VHIDKGVILALGGYEEVPREAVPEELGKSVLMPALVDGPQEAGSRTANARVQRLADRLSRAWTQMREQDQPIEELVSQLCQGSLRVGAPADFVVWNPELVVIGSAPARYGQLRQVIAGGLCQYKDGRYFGE
jgi:imidazolonepropionase-like amidohydrolase